MSEHPPKPPKKEQEPIGFRRYADDSLRGGDDDNGMVGASRETNPSRRTIVAPEGVRPPSEQRVAEAARAEVTSEGKAFRKRKQSSINTYIPERDQPPPAPSSRKGRERPTPLTFTEADPYVPDTVVEAWAALSSAERKAAERKGVSPESLAKNIEDARTATRRRRPTPLMFTEAEPESLPTPLDALPRGVNPDALEKARAARSASAKRLKEKVEDRIAREQLKGIILEGQERVPVLDTGDGNWTELPAVSRRARIIQPVPAEAPAPVASSKEAPTASAAPEVVTTKVPEVAPRSTIGKGMSETQLDAAIVGRRAEIIKINLKERRTRAGSWDHDEYEQQVRELEGEIHDLESAKQSSADDRIRAEEIVRLQAQIDTINEKERRTKAGSWDHDKHEQHVLALEEQIRALEKAGRTSEGPPIDTSPSTPAEGKKAIAEAIVQIQTRTTAETPKSLSPEEQIALAKRFSPEDAAHLYQTGSMPEATKTISSAPPTLEVIAEEKKPEEQGLAVMVNSVLTRQAFGGGKNNKAYDRFVKKYGPNPFPAVPTAAEKVPLERRAEAVKKNEGKRRKWWLIGGGLAGVATSLGILGLIFGKREEAPTPKAPERPAAAKTAQEAGVRAPMGRSTDVPPKATVPAKTKEVQPSAVAEKRAEVAPRDPKVAEAIAQAVQEQRMREEDAMMIMRWEDMAYQKAREALPPGSDERITEVVEIIRANRDNPYAFYPGRAKPEIAMRVVPTTETEKAPVAPESIPKKPEVRPELPKLYSYEENGREVYMVTGVSGEAVFEAAQRYAERLPAGTQVRFDAVVTDSGTGTKRPVRGAFVSAGNGRVGLAETFATADAYPPVDESKLRNPRSLNLDGTLVDE